MMRWAVPQRGRSAGPDTEPAPQARAAGTAPPAELRPVDRRVIWVGGIVFAVLMALSTRYGFHRDELYFLDCARHLQAGYVDQPVLTPLLAWVSLSLFGVSLPGLRLWPALGGLGHGGRRRADRPRVRRRPPGAAAGRDRDRHHAGPARRRSPVRARRAFDMLAWAGLALVVARIGRTGDPRWWLARPAWSSASGWPTSTAWGSSPSPSSSARCSAAAGGWSQPLVPGRRG